ncbi:MAG TPA: hypothetical protein VG146_18185 [Verrucomicrobiae bacterium]|nr:hypothetical protein [Verrucomicrobiae bacterium]
MTITQARKNLGNLLEAAVRGESIGLISGPHIIALRKVEVESTNCARSEYGVSDAQLEEIDRLTDRRFQKMKSRGKLKLTTRAQLKALFEKTARA